MYTGIDILHKMLNHIDLADDDKSMAESLKEELMALRILVIYLMVFKAYSH